MCDGVCVYVVVGCIHGNKTIKASSLSELSFCKNVLKLDYKILSSLEIFLFFIFNMIS